jgi:hypothetical protein
MSTKGGGAVLLRRESLTAIQDVRTLRSSLLSQGDAGSETHDRKESQSGRMTDATRYPASVSRVVQAGGHGNQDGDAAIFRAHCGPPAAWLAASADPAAG